MAIKREEINGRIFIAQTTYYIYDSEGHLTADHAFLRTSNKKVFDRYKKIEKSRTKHLTSSGLKF